MHILVKRTITVVGAGADDAAGANETNNKPAIFNNWSPFTNCITEINDTQADNAKNLDIVIVTYDLKEYSDNCSKTLRSLYQFCRNKPHATITDFELFKFKWRFLDNTNNAGIINAEIAVLSKYLNNIWRTL